MLEIINLLLLLIVIGQIVLLSRRKPTTIRRHKDEIILDTCALIDGRIVELVDSGFLRSELTIPRSVIAELQHLADHGDPYKRERARFGLDVAKQLQESASVTISTEDIDTDVPVDERLIALAKAHHASLYTTDFNLNKVAQIEGVHVLNINELSQQLRPHVLPGETREIKIIDKGQDRQQGVGYLPDGTMVVVERASNKIGKTLKVEFTRMLQTQAGRMMFAQIWQPAHASNASNNNTSTKRAAKPAPTVREPHEPTTY
ncbi:MAG TPA: TRAM domain-containing protein [Candidatus Saccharimonadales bacterium]|nr:TRAM domain-containing protein [Candidatus Saccharimonadales bacterium]